MNQMIDQDNTEIRDCKLQLEVGFAQASSAGIKPVNEDFCAFQQADNEHALVNKGVCCLLADGVSSAEAGREASHFSVENFLLEYYRTPDTWSVKKAGQKTLSTINLQLYKKSHSFAQQEKGFLCTFTGLVIKSRTAYFFHAGDSRLYLLRDGELKQLTRDHTANLGGGKSILARAVGMDNSLQIDYGTQTLQVGDIFLLTSDGVHDFVSFDEMKGVLSLAVSEEEKCTRLMALSKENESDDNISCVVAHVNSLPSENIDDFNHKLTRLPFPPDLSVGMEIDGFKVEKEIFASSRSQVYLVTDIATGQKLVMKTPSINFEDDTGYIDRFIQEEWIGKRIDSPHVVKIINQNRQRNFLYYLMDFVPGVPMDVWMKNNPLPTPKKAIQLVKQIAVALEAFHQSETIHQDLKPGNIIISEDMQVTVIDFGSVFVAGIAEIFTPLEHHGVLGTATYSDPHYLLGKNTSVQGDIYALATITYELFTGQLPYGENIDRCQSELDFDRLRYHDAHDINPIIPLWFDRALAKGVSLDLSLRYQRLGDFVSDITKPNPLFLQDDPQLDNSRGLWFWQFMSAFWVVMLILVVILFSMNS